MRPLIVLWLGQHGLPGWLAPSYFVLVGLSAFFACWLVMRLARRDGVNLSREARTLLLAYVGALLGGYLLEALRAIPDGLSAHSLGPIFRAGRAAYGGLLTAVLFAALYRLHHRQPLAAFFDRTSLSLGLVYFAVRSGCFLAGCDYGIPTSSPLGVRYPPGTLAALEHAARGWVPFGAPSLPTHPTQLYEGGVALMASLGAGFLYYRGVRPGGPFALWMGLYGIGRFLIEFLRGDYSRGIYHGWSSAQYISIGLCLLVSAGLLHDRRLLRAQGPRLQPGGA